LGAEDVHAEFWNLVFCVTIITCVSPKPAAGRVHAISLHR
jgi:hypothetical protein